jgi:hypothetical protein
VSPVDAGVGRYSRQVASSLRSLPRSQRNEIASDVRQRLLDDGINAYDAAVRTLGTPRRYAAELAVAMEVGPPRRRRWPWLVVAAVAAAGVAVAVVASGPSVPDRYPLHIEATLRSGGGETVGSLFVMPHRTDERVTIGIVWRNDGHQTVRVDRVVPFLGFSIDAQGGVTIGDQLPAWRPHVLVEDLGAGTGFSVNVDDPAGSDTFPFSIAPGAAVFMKLSGPPTYCFESPTNAPDPSNPFSQVVSDHISLDTTIDGVHRSIAGPEIVFTTGHCS